MVLPEQDAVIAITSGLGDMPAVLELAWQNLLPAMKAGGLPENAEALESLRNRLKGLTLRKPRGSASSPMLGEVAGKTYAFPPNDRKIESLRIEPGASPDALALVTKADGREQRVECGLSDWKRSTIVMTQVGLFPSAKVVERKTGSAAAWVADDTLEIKTALTETPFVRTIRLKFAGDEVTHDSGVNVRGKDPTLVGRKP